MLTVAEVTSLFSSTTNTHGEVAHHPYHACLAEPQKGRIELDRHHSQQPEHSRDGRYPMLPICSHQSADLSPYCQCSNRYLVPTVAHMLLKCAKHVTDSGSICGGCSINYVQFIKLHIMEWHVSVRSDVFSLHGQRAEISEEVGSVL